MSHNFPICRAIYQVHRENGAPPVFVTKLGQEFFFAESKDGKVSLNVTGCCCKWAMKSAVAEAWREQANLTHP